MNSTFNVIKDVKRYLNKKKEIDTIVIASTSGKTALEFMEVFDPKQYNIVVVTHCYGYEKAGENQMHPEMRQMLLDLGAKIFTGPHSLSVGERSIRNTFGGIYPLELISETLCMFSKGVKVCVEFSSMALDAGLIQYGCPIISVAGEVVGADTALCITPQYSHNILKTRVHELICKPF